MYITLLHGIHFRLGDVYTILGKYKLKVHEEIFSSLMHFECRTCFVDVRKHDQKLFCLETTCGEQYKENRNRMGSTSGKDISDYSRASRIRINRETKAAGYENFRIIEQSFE